MSFAPATQRGLMRVLLLYVVAKGACGCAPLHPVDRGVPLDDAVMRQRLIDSLKQLYPPAFRTVHRAVVTVQGRDIALTGILAVEGGSRIRMIARHDFGATVFDVLDTPEHPASVVSAAPQFPASVLIRGPLADARLLLLLPRIDDARAVSFGDDFVGLIVDSGGDVFVHYLFDRQTLALTQMRRIVGGRLVQHVQIGAVKSLGEPPGIIPTQIELEHEEFGYRMTIEVISFNPGQVSPGVFRPPLGVSPSPHHGP